ncbi:flagellin [Heliorestis convoluta]|uniref:Flagellin n=1 Tax=Heliorestis convoluta TaxID=356322 RepID=A0A5Q2N4J6_9FIRM|nr:flagellin [Heliorestis convoluta]QGG47495.1 flagellin [Heliorestis convoluta]
MIINHNAASSNTLTQITKNTKKLSVNMQRLSSGLRINTAADDAAGLTISKKMRGQIRGLQQADRNILDGISLIQTAEAALAQIQNPQLQRMRELIIQAKNDTLTTDDRQLIQQEIEQIKESIDDIANNTEFNGIKLLNGSNPYATEAGEKVSHKITNVLSSHPVGATGNFQFATNEGYPTTSLDNNQRLVFGSGGTSHPSVRIDGESYPLRSYVQQQTQVVNGIHSTVYNVNNVEITQSVRIVGQYNDKYEISYNIKNKSDSPKEIGFQFHVDTMLGNDDHAPFVVNGSIIHNETMYTGSDIPTDFVVYNQTTGSGSNAEFQAHGILKTMGEFIVHEEPSKFAIGHYNRVSSWDFSPSGTVGDSGYSVYWNERVIESGSSFVVNTFYGQSVPPTVTPPSLEEEDFYDIILQIGPNEPDQYRIRLVDARAEALGIHDISVDPKDEAARALLKLDAAITKVSTARSLFGSSQNRLEYITKNASNYGLNLTEAESRISDADLAEEVVDFTRRNIQNQASQAMLAQAHQQPQSILQLLR